MYIANNTFLRVIKIINLNAKQLCNYVGPGIPKFLMHCTDEKKRILEVLSKYLAFWSRLTSLRNDNGTASKYLKINYKNSL